MGRRDLNWEFGERWAIVLLLRSLDLIILYQIRLMISVAVSAVKPDPTSILVVVEVELVVVEIVALQCLEVDLVPIKVCVRQNCHVIHTSCGRSS